MLKLLLKEENQKLKKEYLLRFLTILFFGLSGILILILVSLVPAYMILKIDQKVLNQELSVAQNTELNSTRRNLKGQLSELQKTLNIVDTPTNTISPYIQSITERQPRDINILNINFQKDATGKKIVLQGTSNSRGSLATFIDLLEKVDSFESVNLPFSSFARDSDIPFSITINLAVEQQNEK